ncbi:soluble lytic murein transglycosylase-like protein [Brevundimonas nasdae]|uniref:lytic transglycosylase domain-containing protein n=1 Tax=Brevundimonas nasdae TaxID=172043 RepID=UPI001F231D18|nr:lytic transglycosylase domain-containing protein [Brevundimonas nasdae]MDQ0450393.1 soluble lytic murein transglycosylase-like protein [Brevundimonas nasdae]
MFRFSRAMIAPTLALTLSAVAVAAQAETPYATMAASASASTTANTRPTALSSADRLSYTTAFDALRRGDLEAARVAARQAQDRVLLGQVEFERLFHPNYNATYEELTEWLQEYSDLPIAGRVYDLAMRRRPDGAIEPIKPAGFLGRTWNSVVNAVSGGGAAADPMKTARIAYNNDDLTGASAMGREIGDWWTVGLAEWRMGEFNEAFNAFDRVAQDPTEDPWVRSGGALWAARAAGKSARQNVVTDYLRLAAQWPATFYGQIALRQLGEEPVIENLGPRPYAAEPRLRRAFHTPDAAVDAASLEAFVQNEPRARRALAYYEVGRRADGDNEMRSGLRTAAGDASRMWAALARIVSPARETDASRIDANRYPIPDLQPEGGFTIERALVYAVARKESDFNPNARSSVGAYGIMQVMPTTAAELSGDRSFVSTPNKLLTPAVNMRLGQTYVNRMLQRSEFQGDILRAVASYNAGPGPMLAAVRKLGPDADPLLLIETIDVPQAREYVEKVVAAYWIYQRMFGGPLNTLDAVASGATLVPISLDYVPPPPVADEIMVAQTTAVSDDR